MKQQKLFFLILVHWIGSTLLFAQNPNVIQPEGEYPYWPTYQHLEVEDLDTIQAQKMD